MKTGTVIFLTLLLTYCASAQETDCDCLPGRDGEQGLPGRDGQQGFPGRDGRDGSPGRDGREGPPGRDGQDGYPGPRGTRGLKGEPGPAGGPQGPQGIQGEKGSTGNQGLPGLQGMKGEKGGQGIPGQKGLEGEKGPNGPHGETGGRGPRGDKGQKGETGISGPIGLKGQKGARGLTGPRTAGVVYTRWGKSSCPSVSGTTMVYTGRAGGSHYTHAGAANYLCMPLDPEYTLPFVPGVNGNSYLFGSEYEGPVVGTHNHNVPCAVCLASSRETVLMIPAKTSCPNNEWTREYYGYLMSERHHGYHHRSMYECVDRGQESIPGSHADVNGALFYHVEATCDGMQCPPYDPQKELNCVVCTI